MVAEPATRNDGAKSSRGDARVVSRRVRQQPVHCRLRRARRVPLHCCPLYLWHLRGHRDHLRNDCASPGQHRWREAAPGGVRRADGRLPAGDGPRHCRLGLYQLFLDPNLPVPDWLRIDDLDQLTMKVMEVVELLLCDLPGLRRRVPTTRQRAGIWPRHRRRHPGAWWTAARLAPRSRRH